MSPATAPINPNNHGPRLILAAALMLVYTFIALGIRLTARWPSRMRSIQKEDVLLIAAAICSIGYTASVCVAVSHDFGHHEGDIARSDMISLQKALLSSFLLFFVTEGLANLSYSLFLQSLSEAHKRRLALRVLYGIIAATALAGVIGSAVSIASNHPPSRYLWIVLGAIEIATLATLFLLNMWMIWTMQTPWLRKVKASLWFSVVLIVIAVIIVRLVYTPQDLYRADFTFNTINFFVLLTIEMHISITNAAYPNLLVFVNKASTGFYNTAPRNTTGPQSNISANDWRNGFVAQHESLKLRDDLVVHTTNMAHGEHRNSIGLESHGSQAILVSRSITVDG